MVLHETGRWVWSCLRWGMAVVIAVETGFEVGADDEAEPAAVGRIEQRRWVGQFDEGIGQRLLDREERPEAVREIVLDWIDFEEWLLDKNLREDRDLFHQIFRDDSVLSLSDRLRARPDGHGDLVMQVVYHDTGGPLGRDLVKENERYPPVSEAGWRTIRAPGQGSDGLLEWNSFEPSVRGGCAFQFLVREDGSVKLLDFVSPWANFPSQVWWGDFTGDGELDVVQWKLDNRLVESEDGERVRIELCLLEVWRVGWVPELLGAVLVEDGVLNRARLPLYEIKPPAPGLPRTIELIPRRGLQLPLESLVLRWNRERLALEAEAGGRTEGRGWKLISSGLIQEAMESRRGESRPLGLPRELIADERWVAVDLEDLMAVEERDRWQAEIEAFRGDLVVPHIFGDDPVDAEVAEEQKHWRSRRSPPFDFLHHGYRRMYEWSPREAVDFLVRYHMPGELTGHYHVLVEPEAEEAPWDARAGWMLFQSGAARGHLPLNQGMLVDDLFAIGWGAGDTAWQIRLSALWPNDAPGKRFGAVEMKVEVATWERSRAAWLASAWWWLDQHRSLTLTHDAPAGWPPVSAVDDGFGGLTEVDVTRLWLEGEDRGMRLYLPAQRRMGVAWTGPWSRRTTHAFAEGLFSSSLRLHPTHRVASLGDGDRPELVWQEVRQWLDGSHPAFEEDGVPPLPAAVVVELVKAVAQNNHQPGREWLLSLKDGLPEPDEEEVALSQIITEYEMDKAAWERRAGEADRFSSEEARASREGRIRLEAAQAELLGNPGYRLRRVLPLALRQLDAWGDKAELRAWAGEEDAPGRDWAQWWLEQLGDVPSG